MRNLVLYLILAFAISNVILTQPALARQAPRATVEDKPEPVRRQAPRATVEDKPESVGTVPSASDVVVSDGSRDWTTIEIVLSVSLLVFAFLIFVLQTILIMKLKLDWTPYSILRFNGLTLIITGGILLVVAGYSNQQIAPVIGLLGAIAGYLLGTKDMPGKAT